MPVCVRVMWSRKTRKGAQRAPLKYRKYWISDSREINGEEEERKPNKRGVDMSCSQVRPRLYMQTWDQNATVALQECPVLRNKLCRRRSYYAIWQGASWTVFEQILVLRSHLNDMATRWQKRTLGWGARKWRMPSRDYYSITRLLDYCKLQ